MKILKIEIDRLRALDALKINLAPNTRTPLDLLVLAGPNGCGKTSVLEACLWALHQDAMVTPRRLPKQDYRIELIIEHEDASYRIIRTPDRHSIESEGRFPPIAFPKKGLPDWLKIRALYFSSWRIPRLIGSVGLTTGEPKNLAKAYENTLARVKQGLVDLQAASAFPDQAPLRHRDSADLFSRIAGLWRELYPDKNGRFAGKLVNPDALGEAGGKPSNGANARPYDVFMWDADHPDGIPVDELSSGEIEAFAMIGSLVMDNIGFDLICIDEPELHLHPAWHRAIMRVLRRAAPGAQIICATHSEHILDAVYSHQRFTLLPERDPRVAVAEQP